MEKRKSIPGKAELKVMLKRNTVLLSSDKQYVLIPLLVDKYYLPGPGPGTLDTKVTETEVLPLGGLRSRWGGKAQTGKYIHM